MIEVAFFGQAFADAELKEGRRGKYAAILASTDNAGEEDEHAPFLVVKLVVPLAMMDEALTIKKGDRLYVEGAASIGVWYASGGAIAKPSVSVKVHHIRKARIGEHREAQKLGPMAEQVAAALTRPIEELPDLPAFVLKEVTSKQMRETVHAQRKKERGYD